jgi:hypothetical protein
MKTGMKITLGCLATPFILLLLFGVLVVAFRALPMRSSEQASANIEQPITTVTAGQLAAEGLNPAESGALQPAAVSMNLWLEEGNFTIKVGPAGSGVRVEGDYDAGMYELKQQLDKGDSGAPVYNLSFLPRYSMLRRILTHGGVVLDDDTNRLTIYLPRDLPMVLRAQVRKGQSHLELGGLSLKSATLDLEMGEHRITVDEPNPIEMDSFETRSGMGEVKMQNLGNLRAGSISVWGKMGEIGVDLGRQIARDTKLYTRMRMGEMKILLPRGARINARTSVFLGGSSGEPEEGGNEENAGLSTYQLDVDAGASFGEVKYVRY